MEARGIFSTSVSRVRVRAGDERPESRTENGRLEAGDGSIIVTVVENRAREICICKMDTQNISTLEIFLLMDNHSYNEAIGTIQQINPDEVLLHDGTRHGILAKKIEEECRSDSRIMYISRQYFDQDRGADLLKKVLAGEVDADLVAKYIVLSGAYCLLRYVENCNGYSFTHHSMRVEYGTVVSKRMSIDRRTAVNLELISNARSGNQRESLFGAINNTKTVVGARLLRSNILRPSTDLPTINTRLDMVELLLRHNKAFTDVVALLQQFPDLDKMLTGLTSRPKTITQKTAKVGIDTLIYMKQALRTAPEVAHILQGLSRGSATGSAAARTARGEGPLTPRTPVDPADKLEGTTATASDGSGDRDGRGGAPTPGNESTTLLDMITLNLQDPALRQMEASINAVITESTSYSRKAEEMRHQECFALRTGIHGLLDVSRKTYLQTVEDLYQLGERYALDFGVPIKVSHNSSRGYFLSLPSTALDPLPEIFTQPVLNRRTISCSTEEFSSLSDRAHEAITQALTLTHELTQTLLAELRENIYTLFRLTDSVAMLDMLSSFADLVALSPHPFSRPVLHTHNTTAPVTVSNDDKTVEQQSRQRQHQDVGEPLVVNAGRHPVISTLPMQQLASSFVPNDLFLSPLQNFHVITGPNGSGKTVYIKQTALIIIMAQIGCFVPARHASIPIRDRILSRLGTSDDMEHNMSTFFTEMKETAYILSNVSDRSLVIIDELGRGTSTIDGLSIAFAIAEQLLGTRAMNMSVTHYPQLTALAQLYPNVKNVHMKTSLDVTSTCIRTAAAMTSASVNSSSSSSSGGGGGGNATSILQSHTTTAAGGLKYLREVGNGPCDMNAGYGILMAEQSGFCRSVTARARALLPIVREQYPVLTHQHVAPEQDQQQTQQQQTQTNRSMQSITILLQRLRLLKTSTLDNRGMQIYLQNMRQRIPEQTARGMLQWLDKLVQAQSDQAPPGVSSKSLTDAGSEAGAAATETTASVGARVSGYNATATPAATISDPGASTGISMGSSSRAEDGGTCTITVSKSNSASLKRSFEEADS